MPALRILISLLAFYSGALWAQLDLSVDCGIARDPERCEARQAAIAACSDLRSTAKTACINQYLPPPDCSKASNPGKCEAIERAKETCKGQTGKALKACLGDKSPHKKATAKKGKKKAAAKPAKSKPKAKTPAKTPTKTPAKKVSPAVK